MNTLNFVVARFVPDLVKNEPINVGIIVNDPKTNKSQAKFIENFRPLSSRFPDSNIGALKDVIETFRGEYEFDSKHIRDLSKSFHYQLRFTESRAVKANHSLQALKSLYKQYISIEPEAERHRFPTKTELRKKIAGEIRQAEFKREWIRSRPIIDGNIGRFTVDYGFQNGHITDLMHAISFAASAETAYTKARALALSMEDARDKNNGLKCTVIIDSSGKENHGEYYESAVGYLKDKACDVKGIHEIRPCLHEIRDKLARAS